MQSGVVDEVKAKMEQALAEENDQGDPRTRRVAHPDARKHNEDYPPLQDYLAMAKKMPTPITAATITNGAVLRLYTKYWRKEPVGVIKRALRMAIATWVMQNNM